MLDEFSATTIDAPENPSQQSGPGLPIPHVDTRPPESTADDFSRQLQDQMAALMGEIDESPEMRRELETMMKELGATAAPGVGEEGLSISRETPAVPASSITTEDGFQETIRKTMERMQASGEQATAAAAANDSDDILAQMLKEMQGSVAGSQGGEEDISKMLMGMMEQLTNKDILYEPMKELNDKYPSWMAKNKKTARTDDLQRYEEQQRVVGEMVSRFERDGYSDSNATDREFIVERMQKVSYPPLLTLHASAANMQLQMQAAGSPPSDLVGDISAAQEALGDLDSGCPQQ